MFGAGVVIYRVKVLQALLRLLRRVADHHEENKMTAENLAIVIAPNIVEVENTGVRAIDCAAAVRCS